MHCNWTQMEREEAKYNEYDEPEAVNIHNLVHTNMETILLSNTITVVKGPFCDNNMLFLWNTSADKDNISLFPNFPVDSGGSFVSWLYTNTLPKFPNFNSLFLKSTFHWYKLWCHQLNYHISRTSSKFKK